MKKIRAKYGSRTGKSAGAGLLDVEQIQEFYFQTKKEGKTPEEIAQTMGVTPETVKLALASLKANWRGSEGVYADAAKSIRTHYVKLSRQKSEDAIADDDTVEKTPEETSEEAPMGSLSLTPKDDDSQSEFERLSAKHIDESTSKLIADMDKIRTKINSTREEFGLPRI